MLGGFTLIFVCSNVSAHRKAMCVSVCVCKKNCFTRGYLLRIRLILSLHMCMCTSDRGHWKKKIKEQEVRLRKR